VGGQVIPRFLASPRSTAAAQGERMNDPVHPPRPYRLRTFVGHFAPLRDKAGNAIRTSDAVVRVILRGGVLAALLLLGGRQVGRWGDRVLQIVDSALTRQAAAIERLSDKLDHHLDEDQLRAMVDMVRAGQPEARPVQPRPVRPTR
jgi:hypothetical protein